MKIVKRDGRTVDYNPEKIAIAIRKANDASREQDRVSEDDIASIIKYIESLDKKRMLVEDIQDIIEEKLMEKGKYALAKKYIIYRYKRSIIRQSNTTDASILSLLKNSSVNAGNYLVANKQRDVMAGEASKDLAYRLLLPKNVVEAEKKNRIKFTKLEHFTEPVIESSKVNLEDMLDNGTVINGVMIESPKSFQSACNILVEIVGSVSFSQTGAIYIELKDLFKYYNLTYEKKYAIYKSLMKDFSNDEVRALSEVQSFLEVKSGIQTIFYQLNTLTLPDGEVPEVYFLVNLEDITEPYQEKIVFEFVKQKTRGIKNMNGEMVVPRYPSVVFSLNQDSPAYKTYDYIANELLSSNCEYIIMNDKRYREFVSGLNRWNQGSLVLNLGRIALESENEDAFMVNLEEDLNHCYEGLLCRNHNLQGVYSDKSPIHWQYGAIVRLASMERIDDYLKKEHSYMNLVVVGFEAAVKILGDNGIKSVIREKLESTIKRWNKENSFDVVLSNYYDDSVIEKMFEYDSSELKRYGVSSYFDSLEFMENNYFKNGSLYYLTDKPIDACDINILDKNLIVKKKG